MKKFNDKAFFSHIDQWVQEVDDIEFCRAWAIAQACIKVHARIDREPDQSAREATRQAWMDWMLAFEDELATYAMIGLLHEFTEACPRHFQNDGTLDRKLQEAAGLATGTLKQPPVGRAVSSEPLLFIIDGGETAEG